MKTQLLLTFTTIDELQHTLQDIRSLYKIVYNFIYILQNADVEEDLFITYNIDTKYRPSELLNNTILVHRKKQSNTLYTINALNKVIRHENNGILDKTHEVQWNLYSNSLILTSNEGIKIIPTEIYEIIDLGDTIEST